MSSHFITTDLGLITPQSLLEGSVQVENFKLSKMPQYEYLLSVKSYQSPDRQLRIKATWRIADIPPAMPLLTPFD
jgi:hypothetical protein